MKIKELSLQHAEKLQLSAFNRTINPDHVARLATAMAENFSTFGPILISATGTTIDGAHRTAAFINCVKSGKLPISARLLAHVIETTPEQERILIQKTNSLSKNWTLQDYIKSNIAAGNVAIKRLAQWCSDKELCINEKRKTDRIKYAFGAAFLVGKRSDEALRGGTFELTDEDIKTGTEIYNEINELRNILNWRVATIRYDIFAQVWRDMRDLHPFRDWKKEFKAQSKQYTREIPYTVRQFEQLIGAIDSSISRKNRRAAKTADK